MIAIPIPGRETRRIERVVLDVNGTLTLDGELLPGVAERIARLREQTGVELLTADTRGRLAEVARALQVRGVRLEADAVGEQKRACVERLGATRVAAIGNGMNDVGMLLEPLRLVATLRP